MIISKVNTQLEAQRSNCALLIKLVSPSGETPYPLTLSNLMQESWQKYLAEALATFAFVFVLAGATLVQGVTGTLGVPGVALAGGLALLAMIYATAHHSGAHLNPAVTVALWATGHVKTAVGVGYILSQLVGAVVAALFLRVVFVSASPSLQLGNVWLGAGVTPGVGIFMEAVLTFVFVYTYFATVVDKKNEGGTGHGALALGLVFAAAVMLGATITGGALNPARVFGPALVSGAWSLHYVYWVGPLIGALVAAFVYHFGYLKRRV